MNSLASYLLKFSSRSRTTINKFKIRYYCLFVKKGYIKIVSMMLLLRKVMHCESEASENNKAINLIDKLSQDIPF